MNKQLISKVVLSSALSAAMLVSVSASAGTLPAIDSVVTTTFDKSIIHGHLAHKPDGTLDYDSAGNARFVYSGEIYATSTDNKTGELVSLGNKIGEITGEAAFPQTFVKLSAAVNGIMDAMVNPDNPGYPFTGPMPQMPSIVPWTCNHCDMTVGGSHYVSIVDVLHEYMDDGVTPNPYYSADIANAFDNGVMGGAEAVFNDTRMKGRAFTAFGPASFDPVERTMGVRMAGCSALVAIDGPNAGKIGTLCMNSTAVFNVNEAMGDGTFDEYGFPNYTPTSQISAEGSSNCVTVLQPMPQQ